MTDTPPSPMPAIEDPVALVDLDFADLRAYRNRLNDEAERVSYWRRLIQARLDVLNAETKHLDGLSLRALAAALGTTGTGARRRQLLSIHAADDLPDLPGLSELWTAAVDPHNEDDVTRTVAALSDAEQTLTAYRTALYARVDAATEELISRYREEPDLCLALLPPERAAKPS